MNCFNLIALGLIFLFQNTIRPGESVVLDRAQLQLWYPEYSSLNSIDVWGKELTSIAADAFAGLTKIEYLFMFLNQLTTIDSQAFKGLVNLRDLYLWGNKITSIDPSAFSTLASLQILYLFDNNLVSIDRNILVGLVNLEYVYIGNNPISQLQPAFVIQLCKTNPQCLVYLWSFKSKTWIKNLIFFINLIKITNILTKYFRVMSFKIKISTNTLKKNKWKHFWIKFYTENKLFRKIERAFRNNNKNDFDFILWKA